VRKLIKTPALQALGVHFVEEEGYVNPNCRHHELFSDDYWRCKVRHEASSGYHPVGTCKMGSVDDGSSVVDSELRCRRQIAALASAMH